LNFTFLNGIFLAGVAAAVIPIIIHLLQRRQLKRIEFSDLRFLGPLNQQRMRSLNLRRLMLLVLRVLIVALTAVAMARPSVRGGLTRLVPTQARTSVLLLVDTSYSMASEGSRGTTLDAAREAAEGVLGALSQGDEVSLMTFDERGRRWFQTPVRDFDVVRERLRQLQPSYRGTDWERGLEQGLQELDGAMNPNRELYVISDFVGTIPESLQANLGKLQDDVQVTFVPVQVEPFVNVSLDKVHVPPGAVLRDDPVQVAATVRNHATDVPADCILRLDLNGEAKGEVSLRLGREAVQTHDFTVVATQASEMAGSVSKQADRLPTDDARYFVLPVLAQLQVLLVQGSSGEGGGFFLSRALEPTRQERSPIRLSQVEASRFSSQDLEGVQVVMVSSDARLSESQVQVLSGFIDAGGGLCLLTGQRTGADAANRLLARVGTARVRGVVNRQEGFLNLVDLRPSGILAGFQEEALRALENVRFSRYAEIAPGPEGRTLLHFAGNEPALVEGAHGLGRFLLFAFDAGTDGSELALSPMFLPLLHRSVVYLAGETGRQQLDYHVGERIEIMVPLGSDQQASLATEQRYAQAGTPDAPASDEAASARNFTVTTPSGEREAVEARFVGKMAIVAYEKTDDPGHYRFEGAGGSFVRAVNVDTAESERRAIDTEDLAQKLSLEVTQLRDARSLGQHIREARHGKELYKLIVLMVLLLLVVELFLSRASSRAAPPAET
jgi:hypothetical protein